MFMGVGLPLKSSRGMGTTPWTPSWVSTNGARLNHPTAFGTDSPLLTFRGRYRNLNTTAAAQFRLMNITGGVEFNVRSDGRLQVFLHKGASNDYAISWISTATIKAAGETRLHVRSDTTSTPVFSVKINGVEVAGTAVVSVAGAVRVSRAGYGIGSAHSSATDLFTGEVAYVLLEAGAARADAHYLDAGGSDKNPETVGSPMILFSGLAASWNAGNNLGIGPDFAATGTYLNA